MPIMHFSHYGFARERPKIGNGMRERRSNWIHHIVESQSPWFRSDRCLDARTHEFRIRFVSPFEFALPLIMTQLASESI